MERRRDNGVESDDDASERVDQNSGASRQFWDDGGLDKCFIDDECIFCERGGDVKATRLVRGVVELRDEISRDRCHVLRQGDELLVGLCRFG